MISGFLKVQVGTLENEHVVRAVGENSVSRLEGEENGGLRNHYQELLWFRWTGRCGKAGTCTVEVTEVCLQVCIVLSPLTVCKQNLKPISYIVRFTGVTLLIPFPFCPCHAPNTHKSLGVSRAEKYFTQDTWGLITEREAGGFCTGRG